MVCRRRMPAPELFVRRHRAAQPWTYRALDQEQRRIAARVEEGGAGALLLSEVAPVITWGRRADERELRVPRVALAPLGIDLYETDRGGLATYHGPGQWVLFAVDSLTRLTGDPRGVRRAVEGLLEIMRLTARIYEPRCEIRSGTELGLWTPRGKLGSVGVKVSHGVLLHGLALNAFRTPQSFQGLRPCGLEAPVDFLLPQADDGVFRALGDRLLGAAGEVFWRG